MKVISPVLACVSDQRLDHVGNQLQSVAYMFAVRLYAVEISHLIDNIERFISSPGVKFCQVNLVLHMVMEELFESCSIEYGSSKAHLSVYPCQF